MKRLGQIAVGVLLGVGVAQGQALVTPAVPSPGASVLRGRGPFTRADSLRGTLGPYRRHYDVRYYDLALRVSVGDSSIAGSNAIVFTATERLQTLQVDLFAQFAIDSITGPMGRAATWRREGHALWVTLAAPVAEGATDTLTVWYHGRPQLAKNPPWDGGFVWRRDPAGKPWLGVACEGLGASSWWPLKDHLSDEPDSMRMTFAVPQGLMAVGNGQLRSVLSLEDGTDVFEWVVTYPINSYNVTLNVADYAHFGESYESTSGEPLQLDYYVLRSNLERAKKQFAQVKPMLACFERAMGPYPFAADGYALVETAYYGMEHQGAIAYGAGYRNLPGWGFDYIIVHESGHEWFGNRVSAADHADLWVHESFTTYTEVMYLECVLGPEAVQEYLNHYRTIIVNKDPIQGPRGVNFDDWKESDMYYKGAWMLHTLRGLVGDSAFAVWIRALQRDLAFKPVATEDVIAHANRFFARDLGYFFAQYLYHSDLPRLELSAKPKGKRLELKYRWVADVADFRMPVTVEVSDATGARKRLTLSPTRAWQTQRVEGVSHRVMTDRALIEVR